MTELERAFTANLPPGREGGERVADRLTAVWQAARAAWPELPDDPEGFMRHLATKLASDLSTTAALDQVRAADLYLALHCAAGHDTAIAALLAGPFTVARATLYKMRIPGDLIDDLEQHVRALLLVASAGRPKIADYAGRGDLKSWIASIAARTARKKLRTEQRRNDASDDDVFRDLAAADDDPELAYFKDTYRDAFATAVRDALVVLSVRERNLLRQHHIDRLTLEELATLYAAHRATVARWLAAARERIVEQTRTLLVERLAINEDELESVVRLVQSQVHVSLDRLLRAS